MNDERTVVAEVEEHEGEGRDEKVSRRVLARRALALGVSIPALLAALAACGDEEE